MLKRVSTFSLLGVIIVFFFLNLPSIADYRNHAYNKKVVAETMNILLIHDQDSYLRVKQQVSPYLSDELRKSTFGFDTYDGVITPEPKLRIMSVKGDLSQKAGSSFNYKCNISLYCNLSIPIIDATFIIKIVDGKVTKVERI